MRIALAWVDMSDPTDRAVAQSLAAELRGLGHSVCFVGPKRRADEPSRGIVAGIPTYRVGTARELLEIDSREGIDVWHCHVFARSHRAFIDASRRARWPLVVTSHLILEDYLPFLGGVKGLRVLIDPAAHVAFVDRAARQEFLRLLPGWRSRSSVVYHGAPPRAGAAAKRRRAATPFILSVARLAPYKGQDLLLMAFALVLEKSPSMRLVLCGRDQLKGAVHAFVRALGLEKRVILTGGLAPREVQGLLRDCEFFVLPSRRENFPLAVLEAMAAGKAVIATATGGVPEMIRHGVDGLLVPPNDVEALSRRMAELCGNGALSKRLGRCGRIRCRKFSWSSAAAAYVRLYGEALESRRRSSGIRLKK